MKAVYVREFGSIDNLEIIDVPEPSKPQGTEVLVRVQAAGLNRADLLQVKGAYPPPAPYSAHIPGLEFAGEVAAVGSDVSQWATGERVFGITAGEAQAEYLISDATLLARIPGNLSYAEAAAVPEAFITAHDACFTQAELKQNDILLIHAVGSGVGLAGLQIAKAKGVTVIGTSRTPDKLERCRQFDLDLGIATVDGARFAEQIMQLTSGHGADVILDLVGAAYFTENLVSLALKGRLVLVGLTSGRKADFNLGVVLQKRAKVIGTVLRARSTEEKAAATKAFVDDVVPLLDSGQVRPVADRIFPASEARQAYKYLASNESFGKVVLEF